MKSLSKIVMVIAVLLSSINSFAQIKNAKTETVKFTAIVVCAKPPSKKQVT
jgi:hypothetical protein